MACDYLDQIRGIQPGGPYLLLGWSFGGLVADEIASQLQSQGECETLVALLDSYPSDQQSSPHIPDDSELLADLLKEVDIDPIAWTPRKSRYRIRNSKNDCFGGDAFQLRVPDRGEDESLRA